MILGKDFCKILVKILTAHRASVRSSVCSSVRMSIRPSNKKCTGMSRKCYGNFTTSTCFNVKTLPVGRDNSAKPHRLGSLPRYWQIQPFCGDIFKDPRLFTDGETDTLTNERTFLRNRQTINGQYTDNERTEKRIHGRMNGRLVGIDRQ